MPANVTLQKEFTNVKRIIGKDYPVNKGVFITKYDVILDKDGPLTFLK